METEMARELFRGYLYRRFGDRSTPKHYLSDLTNFFECLAAEEPDKPWPNPVNWRRHGVRVGKALPRDVFDEEVERLFAVIEDVRDAAIFGLMLGAGLRVSGVVDIRLLDLERADPSEQLPAASAGKRSQRAHRLADCDLARQGVSLACSGPETADDHLFLNQHKRKLTKDGVQFRLKQYCEQAGVTLTCHRLRQCVASRRDTFATRLLNQGVSLEVERRLPGHSSLQMSQHYARLFDTTFKDQFESVTAELEGVIVRNWPMRAITAVPAQADFQQVELSAR
jgi:site-specific recombinase XerD